MKQSLILWLAVAAVGVGSLLIGWPATVLVGAVLGILPRVKRPVLLSMLAGMFGWGVPLLLMSGSAEVGALAELLGQIMGLGTAGQYVILAFPPLVGGLLGLSGAWIANAVLQVVRLRQAAEVSQAGSVSMRK
jgi:hypothetical protein